MSANITPQILTWARARCGLSHNVLATKLNVSTDKLVQWESGTSKPTIKQAQSVAKHTHIPFGYLYLDKPPQLNIPIADFRTGHLKKNSQQEVNIYDFVQSLLHKKEWFEQRALKKGSNFNSGHFQGKFSLKNDYLEVAESISEFIEIDSNIRRRNQITPSSLWSSLVDKVISKGIWLMRTGVVGNNTHRKLNSDSSKGLALKSTFMPVIWVNSSLSDAPKIYTLIHEMAHLWIDSEGISKQQDEDEIASTNGRSLKEFENLEKFCDLVAAEVLVPAKNLEYLWQSQSSSLDNVENLHKNFGVSRFVIAKRAADLSIVTKSDLANLTVILRQRIKPPIQNEEQEETENSGGGNFYNTLLARNGMEFTKAVVEDAFSGDLLLNAACDLLDIKNSSTLEGAHKFLINKGEL